MTQQISKFYSHFDFLYIHFNPTNETVNSWTQHFFVFEAQFDIRDLTAVLVLFEVFWDATQLPVDTALLILQSV
jgi:hypothetical protein